VTRVPVDVAEDLLFQSLRRTCSSTPGVIVLRAGKEPEQADSCPEGLEEESEQRWRFCLPPRYAQPLPPLWEPPIEGIPYEEALGILERHKKELLQLPGVTGVGLSAKGILVLTDNPVLVPFYWSVPAQHPAVVFGRKRRLHVQQWRLPPRPLRTNQ
jgi:hypothetical protein